MLKDESDLGLETRVSPNPLAEQMAPGAQLGQGQVQGHWGPKAADDRAIGWLPPREERIETTCFCSARGGVTIERRGRYRKYLQREKEHM